MIYVKIKSTSGVVPEYQTEGSAGCDICSTEKHVLQPGERHLFSTGIYLEVPHGYECQIRPRSGLAFKNGVTVLNAPGTIDCFYKDSQILTVDGYKCVSDLTIKDQVLSLNEDTFEIEKDIISAIVYKGELTTLSIITDDGIELEVTENTLVMTQNGWKLASDLEINDEIFIHKDT